MRCEEMVGANIAAPTLDYGCPVFRSNFEEGRIFR